MTWAATIPRTGTNWPWNWRLTVLKQSRGGRFMLMYGKKPSQHCKVIILNKLIKKKTRSDNCMRFQDSCQSSCFCTKPSPSAYKSSVIVGGGRGNRHFDRSPFLPTPHAIPVANLQNKPNFPFHQPCFSIRFWAVNSQTPLMVTISLPFSLLSQKLKTTTNVFKWGKKSQ